MESLYTHFFSRTMEGKSYKNEEEYFKDIYSFIDMCLTIICIHSIPESETESLSIKRWHFPKIAVNLNEALDSLLNRPQMSEILRSQDIERQELKAAEFHIKSRILFTENTGVLFPVRKIIREFELTNWESFIFFLSMAASFDTKYETLFSHLQGSSACKQPTIRLALALYELCHKIEKEELGKIIGQQGNLFEYLLTANESKDNNPLMQSFSLRKRVYEYLFEHNVAAAELEEIVEYFDTDEALDEVCVRHDYLEKISRNVNINLFQTKGRGNVLNLYGESGNGKHFFIKHAARQNGFHVLFIDTVKMLDAKAREIQELLKMLYLECILTRSLLCFVDLEERNSSNDDGQKTNSFPVALKYLLDALSKKMQFWFWISREKAHYLLDYPLHITYMELPILTAGERIVLWNHWKINYSFHPDIDLLSCANQYVLTIRGIQEVLKAAHLNSRVNGKTAIEKEDILSAVKQQSPNQLGKYASLIHTVCTWEDLVIEADQKRQMEMICNQLRFRSIVGEEWGFHKKTPYGRGICAMFYGAPGTGKTMAVQVIANELGLDLYRIDLSQMVSKYIGETEKNISTLFKKAKNTNALLFFDEADSLFAKRSEVKDSHDRNANAETAHLLQKLEDYEGITILATNYANNIDDAFKRRIKFMVKFSFPTPEVRYQLWKTILPQNIPCEEELDLEFYARQFELSGSSIKEILSNAAYIAASENRHLANVHIIEAVKLNFAKYGKILTKEDFGYLYSQSQ